MDTKNENRLELDGVSAAVGTEENAASISASDGSTTSPSYTLSVSEHGKRAALEILDATVARVLLPAGIAVVRVIDSKGRAAIILPDCTFDEKGNLVEREK